MPEHFQRPENALKRAEEFLAVDKPKAAQEVLLDVIKSKRHRNWSKVHEEIMEKLIALNVQLKDSKAAKESLFQYKLTCHSVNVKSLEDIVRKYLQLTETRVQQAKAESKKLALERRAKLAKAGIDEGAEADDSVLDKIEDLEVLLSPEDMMLGAVTGEGRQERADIEILVPWIKFLWDAYRNCLDLLRNNKLVERLYQEIAKLAMEFCINYDRKNEFRRLSDSLRTHLNQITRNTKSQNAISLTNPESQALHLDIRICQLDFGIKIELWQEAFKAVEDIHYLMTIPKRAPHPQKLAEFYTKLGVVFDRANMHLFHSCTQHKLFKLTRDLRKNLSQQELSLLASSMLISTMSIPITEIKHGLGKMLDIENALHEKHQKMARLLELERSPSRSSLMQDMVSRYGVLRLVPKPLIKLYNLIETEENTLKMKDEVESILAWIENHENAAMRKLHSLYAAKVRNVMASRILIQVSKLYMTIKFPRLIKLLPGMSREEVERMIVDASRIGQLRVRIDHSKDMIKFGLESDPAPLYVDDEMSIDPLTSCRQDQNEWVSNHLNALSRVLETAIIQLKGDEEMKKNARAKNLMNYNKARPKESSRLRTRREHIEGRIEDCERQEQDRLTKEREKRQKKQNAELVERAEKEKREKEKLEARRKEEEEKAERMRQARDKLETMKKTDLGQKLFKDLTAEMLLTRNIEELFHERAEMLRKSKREDQEKLRKQERNLDYLERAKRQIELPKIEAHIAEEKASSRQKWDEMETERLARMQEEWKTSRETKKRLEVMSADAEAFKNALKKERRDHYQVKKTAFDQEVAEERERRLQERRLERIAERREKWQEECREEERKRQEEEKRIKEQELREAREKAEREREAEEKRLEEERMKKLDEKAKWRPPVDRDRGPGAYGPPGRRGGRPRSPDDRDPYRRSPSPRRRSPGGPGPWRSGGRRMSPPRGRDGPPPRRFDDDGPSGWRRGDRSPGRRSPPRRSPPRRSPPRRSPPRDRRSPPRDRRRSPFGRAPPTDAWRRRDSPPRRSPPRRREMSPPRQRSPPRDTWRRGPSPGRRSPPRRDFDRNDRGAPPAWRSNDDAPRGGDRAPPRERDPAPPKPKPTTDDDGWTTAVDRRTRR